MWENSIEDVNHTLCWGKITDIWVMVKQVKGFTCMQLWIRNSCICFSASDIAWIALRDLNSTYVKSPCFAYILKVVEKKNIPTKNWMVFKQKYWFLLTLQNLSMMTLTSLATCSIKIIISILPFIFTESKSIPFSLGIPISLSLFFLFL